jgi:hypothetical protein
VAENDLSRIHNISCAGANAVCVEYHKGLSVVVWKQDSLRTAFSKLSLEARQGQALFASVLGCFHVRGQVSILD